MYNNLSYISEFGHFFSIATAAWVFVLNGVSSNM